MKKLILTGIAVFVFSLLFVLFPYSFLNGTTNQLNAEVVIEENTCIEDDIIWTAEEGPYLVEGFVLVFSGAKLTIKPGTIVKLYEQAAIYAIGELIIEGTGESPIIFTSIYDDEVGIDNSPWTDQLPEPGIWGTLGVYDGGNLTVDYAILKYGGLDPAWVGGLRSGVIFVWDGTVNITNSEFTENIRALYNFWNHGPVSIHNSKIYNNQLGGIKNNSYSAIDATDNWWGDDSGPYHEILNPDGLGDAITGVGSAYVLFDPWVGKEEPAGLDPVIIVPGIGACINLKVLVDLEPSSYDWSLMGNYYDGIIKTFEVAGFELNKDLFIGCYDWRKTNGLNLDAEVNSGEEYLKYWINKAKSETGASKVDIVAHSMGGLISRSYIQGDNYEGDVDQLIMLGTPNHGSSEAYYPWEGGQIPESWDDVKNILRAYLTILKFKGHNITNVATIQEFIPSLEQLLPTYDYIFDEETQQLIPAHLMVENNSWLRNLNQETEINKLKDGAGINIIYGNGEPTLNTIAVLPRTAMDIQLNRWIDGRPDPDITDYKSNGDKTVTANSAVLGNVESHVMENIKHNELPDHAGLKILELLEIDSEQVFSSPNIDDSLVIIVASPVFPMIIAPDNESRIGYDIGTQSIVNDIEYAQYFSAGDQDVKLIIIPNPQEGEYKIELVGNGDGEYNLASGYFSEDQSIIKEIAGVIIADQIIDYQVELQPDNEESPISDLVTIGSTIADIEEIYENGWITEESSKNLLVLKLEHLQNRLDIFAKQKDNIERLKQKILDKFDERLQKIEQQEDDFIEKSLTLFIKILDRFLQKGVIIQPGYDIIISNINYLRQNL